MKINLSKKLVLCVSGLLNFAMLYGFSGYDALRQQREFMLNSLKPLNSNSQSNVDRYYEYARTASNAWKSGHYYTAIEGVKNKIRYYIGSEINLASHCLELSMLQWNVGNRNEACQAALKAIRILETADYVKGSGCERRAVIFYKKMCSNSLPGTFTYRDASTNGVLEYIMEEPRAVYDKKLEEIDARSRFLYNYCAGMSNTYRMQGESNARRARLRAQNEYLQNTGDTFSPNNPPAYGTKKREEWEACRRIHDIFD